MFLSSYIRVPLVFRICPSCTIAIIKITTCYTEGNDRTSIACTAIMVINSWIGFIYQLEEHYPEMKKQQHIYISIEVNGSKMFTVPISSFMIIFAFTITLQILKSTLFCYLSRYSKFKVPFLISF